MSKLHLDVLDARRREVLAALDRLPKGGIHLRDLASNKAYVIGRRGAWRDYVDMYFLLRDHVEIAQVIRDAKKRFAGAFSEKLFLEQLQYFGDIEDFAIEFTGTPLKKETIQKELAAWGMAYVRKRL